MVHAFQKKLDDSTRKPNKIWVGKESEFSDSSFKKLMKVNNFDK